MTDIPLAARDFLAYAPATGEITWLAPPRFNVAVGSRAGRILADGYWSVCFQTREYRAHRLAWFLMTGEQPPALIDHINRDKADNRWANLRAASSSQNQANAVGKRGRSQRGLPKGVVRTPEGRFRAAIMRDRKQIHLGIYDSPAEAHHAYATKAAELFGEFARAA